MEDWIEIRHRGVKGTALVTEEAFVEVWEPLGWKKIAEAPEEPGEEG